MAIVPHIKLFLGVQKNKQTNKKNPNLTYNAPYVVLSHWYSVCCHHIRRKDPFPGMLHCAMSF